MHDLISKIPGLGGILLDNLWFCTVYLSHGRVDPKPMDCQVRREAARALANSSACPVGGGCRGYMARCKTAVYVTGRSRYDLVASYRYHAFYRTLSGPSCPLRHCLSSLRSLRFGFSYFWKEAALEYEAGKTDSGFHHKMGRCADCESSCVRNGVADSDTFVP